MPVLPTLSWCVWKTLVLVVGCFQHPASGDFHFPRTAGQESYPVSGPKETPVELGREIELKLAVRGMLANVWVDGKLVLADNAPGLRVTMSLPDKR